MINTITDYETYVGESSGVLFLPLSQWPAVYQYDEPENVSLRATSTDEMATAGHKAAEILNETLNVSSESDLSYQSART